MTAVFARPDFHQVLSRLKDRRLHRDLAYCDGRWTAGADNKGFEVTDPASDATVGWVANPGAGETTAAIIPCW